MTTFEQFFHTADSRRGTFLSRLFGIFSEQVVAHWCRCPKAAYANRGRPTLKRPGENRGRTLDFALEQRGGSRPGAIFVAEMKCWLAFEDYCHIRLKSEKQFEPCLPPIKPRNPPKVWSSEKSFEAFLAFGKNPDEFTVVVKGAGIKAVGSILIWGAVTDEGRRIAKEKYGLADVLSVEEMLYDLRCWAADGCEQAQKWLATVGQLRGWSMELFNYFANGQGPPQ